MNNVHEVRKKLRCIMLIVTLIRRIYLSHQIFEPIRWDTTARRQPHFFYQWIECRCYLALISQRIWKIYLLTIKFIKEIIDDIWTLRKTLQWTIHKTGIAQIRKSYYATNSILTKNIRLLTIIFLLISFGARLTVIQEILILTILTAICDLKFW